MLKHEHQWTLVSHSDSSDRPLHELNLPTGEWVPRGGLFGGAFYSGPSVRDMNIAIHERITETINRDYEPRFVSETWACHCGERKTNTKQLPSLMDMLGGKKSPNPDLIGGKTDE